MAPVPNRVSSRITARRCAVVAIIISAAIIVTAAAPPQSAPADTSPPRSTGIMYVEEDAAPFFVELSRSSLYGTIEMYTSVRLVAWRQVGPATNVSNIRLALGYGSEPTAAAEADSELAFLTLTMDEFTERLTFQLTPNEARELVKFVDNVAALELRKPPEHVVTRFVEAQWGDFQLRKNDNGVFVWVPGEPGGWEPLPVERFKAGIQRALADIEKLNSAPPSVEFK